VEIPIPRMDVSALLFSIVPVSDEAEIPPL
jgi:hypothetical protein